MYFLQFSLFTSWMDTFYEPVKLFDTAWSGFVMNVLPLRIYDSEIGFQNTSRLYSEGAIPRYI